MERGLEFTIAGHHLEDALTGDRDPGQAAVETLARAVGLAATGSFRVTSPGGNVDSLPRLGRGDDRGRRPQRPRGLVGEADGLGRGHPRLMATTDPLLIDFDAFRAEQQARPLIIRVGGTEYALPSSPPAAVALDGIRLARRGARDDPRGRDRRARRGPVRHARCSTSSSASTGSRSPSSRR